MNQITNAIAAHASALCEALEDYLHREDIIDGNPFDQTTYNVLEAAALEVSELEFVLKSGHAERLWWMTNPETLT